MCSWCATRNTGGRAPTGSGSENQKQSYDGNAVFTDGGVTYGVEVCLDHLKKRLKLSKGLKTIDIQLVPSCGMYLVDDAIVAKPGGYAFNVDGYANYDTKVLGFNSKLRKAGTGDVAASATHAVDGTGIRVMDILARDAGEIRLYPLQTL